MPPGHSTLRTIVPLKSGKPAPPPPQVFALTYRIPALSCTLAPRRCSFLSRCLPWRPKRVVLPSVIPALPSVPNEKPECALSECASAIATPDLPPCTLLGRDPHRHWLFLSHRARCLSRLDRRVFVDS